MTLKPGERFEREFASWMVGVLHHRRVRTRIHVPGRVANRPYEVDIWGEKHGGPWRSVRAVGVLLLLVCLSTVAFPERFSEIVQWVQREHLWAAVVVDRFAVVLAGLFLAVGGHLLARLTTRRVWVECKDRKTNIKRADVQKLHASVEDVRQAGDRSRMPDDVILVSSAGFDIDALAFAREYGYECYEKREHGFFMVK